MHANLQQTKEGSQTGRHVILLPNPLPAELVTDFLSKLHYVSEALLSFELNAHRDAVSVCLVNDDPEQGAIVSDRIREVAQKLQAAFRRDEPRILARRHVEPTFQDDPHPALEAAGELFCFGRGRFGFGPRLSQLIDYFDLELFSSAGRLNAASHQFPTLLGADVMERCRYLRTFPHSLSLVTHLREDMDAIHDFAATAHWDGKGLACSPEHLAKAKCFLSPNVCFHCYAWLQDSRNLKPQSFTAVGKCFRYESGNLSGLERLWDFTMREWIFVGPREYVLEQRRLATEISIELLDRWNMTYEIRSAADPVAVDQTAIASYQMAFDLKHEVQAALPYKQATLAVGSLNFHEDFFGRALSIEIEPGLAANMGCVGFGLERLALAFLAQHSLDPRRWPAVVAQNLKSW